MEILTRICGVLVNLDMPDPKRHWLRMLSCILAVALIGIIMFAMLFCAPVIERDLREWTDAEKAYIQERFRYHGIDSAVCSGNECWFYRDGEKCRL